ncbi:MAG: hypothetical protein JXA00_00820 [Candidatus Thermoplasmatota archaeon]|nr:hypothetical protein [Candidatus Thermoplasmatota archaeon]
MEKRIVPMVLMGLVVLSGLGAAAFSPNISLKHSTTVSQTATTVSFSPPLLSETDGFIEINVQGATTQWLEPNRPVLPVFIKTFEIPCGSTDIQVTCTPDEVHSLPLTGQVIPARISAYSLMSQHTEYVTDPEVYSSAAFYPDVWYTTELGAGCNENNVQVTFVKVICYPVQYSPVTNLMKYTDGCAITLSYTAPDRPRQPATQDEIDLVIIAPEKFESKLASLVTHKQDKGVATMFKSLEDILSEYTGYDEPEQIKYFIKDMYDTYNITYVLLVGGLKNHLYCKDKDTRSAGYTAWHVPVRYANLPHAEDEAILCDLYYGCLYNGTGGFDSWDSNGDGVYAAWNAPGVISDKFDLYPEVYVSRLAVTMNWEVTHVVNKIIEYESSGPDDKPWYKTYIGIAGKTFYMWAGQPDGEYLCDLAYTNTKLAIPDLTQVKVYATNRDTSGLVPTPKDISKALRQGAGFVDFQGHGYALGWNTIWHDGTYPDDWTGGIGLDNFWRILNGKKQPVIVVGGCHNGLYNVSTLQGMKDKEGTTYFAHGLPSPVCFSWGLIVKPLGGAIATTGCTGYGVGTSGDPSTTLSSELEADFFYEIGQGTTHLGETHGQAIRKYLVDNTIGQTDAYCITNWATFGDPSLLFGGYSS